MLNIALNFSNKGRDLMKKLFIKKVVFFVDYVKIIELNVVHIDVTSNLTRRINGGNESINEINKN